MKPEDQSALESRLGYVFKNSELLMVSLTHPSFVKKQAEEGEHYQRLEFLGDAVLSLVLAEALYIEFPEEREGGLSRNRAALVQGEQLAAMAWELGLDSYLRLGNTEEQAGVRRLDSVLEDVFESLVGAIYLDSDWDTTKAVVLGWYGCLRGRLEERLTDHNPKGELQEWVQSLHGNNVVEYDTISESGPDHRKRFTVTVKIQGECVGQGSGYSKKEAEENAARAALNEKAGSD